MDLILANVEMLSRAESPYDCILAKDECKSEIRRKNKQTFLELNWDCMGLPLVLLLI